MINVLVVDDSALMRKRLTRMLEADPEIKVVGTARDGEDAVAKARALRPDVVTLDVNMPGMDGLTALQHIVEEGICPVVMVSSLTQDGAVVTFEALELGAFDFVAKPDGTISLGIEKVARELAMKVRYAAKTGTLSRINANRNKVRLVRAQAERQKMQQTVAQDAAEVVVAIGVSTGGPKVLGEIIEALPADLGAALLIVQHIPPNFTSSFASRLDRLAAFTVQEASNGDLVRANVGYLGKGGFHMLAKRMGRDLPPRLRLTTQPAHLFVPSVDQMMFSVAESFGPRAVGVLLTGMGDDGADGMVAIRKAGGFTIAESEETAVVFGMPAEAIARGGAELVVPSYQVAEKIVQAVRRLA